MNSVTPGEQCWHGLGGIKRGSRRHRVVRRWSLESGIEGVGHMEDTIDLHEAAYEDGTKKQNSYRVGAQYR